MKLTQNIKCFIHINFIKERIYQNSIFFSSMYAKLFPIHIALLLIQISLEWCKYFIGKHKKLCLLNIWIAIVIFNFDKNSQIIIFVNKYYDKKLKIYSLMYFKSDKYRKNKYF